MPDSKKVTTLSNFQLVRHKALLTPELLEYRWDGNGTAEDPYLVEWLADDPRNPMKFPQTRKWCYTALASVACLIVSFSSSAYPGGLAEIMAEFQVGNIVAFLGVSLYVVGFAVGPMFWAPLSELYGRQNLFIITYGLLVVFSAASTGAQSITQLIVFRFLSGAFGSSPLTNAGGVIADMFTSTHRGLATTIFACGPFLGPILGPIAGGFVGQSGGWRWIMGMLTIAATCLYIPCCLLIPETYGPVLLRLRARKLSKATGKVYLSRLDFIRGPKTVAETFRIAISRPPIILLCEPVVLIISTYMAVIYGTMYMLFAAFPIIFKTGRGWSSGMSGLAFLGIAVGMFSAFGWMIWENTRYVKKMAKYANGRVPAEARLPPMMVGAILIPTGLFWFAWTNSISIQ
jgi:multidrug resistance protein